MIKTIFFLLKIALIVGAVLWIAEHPGSVEVNWMDYTFTLHLGIVAAALFALIFAAFFFNSLYIGAQRLPKTMAHNKHVKTTRSGYDALTKGLSAVAAGDTKTAKKCAKRSAYLLKDKDAGDTHALALLLQAQTARMMGNDDVAHEAFVKLAAQKDGGFLGVRGLLRGALDRNDLTAARALIDKARDEYPKQPWIIQTAFDIYIRQHDWTAALACKTKLERMDISAQSNARPHHAHDDVALRTAQARDFTAHSNTKDAINALKLAHKAAPDFIPAALDLARMYRDMDKRKAALKVIENTWRAAPHPDLALLWMDTMPEKKRNKAGARMQWMERLVLLNADSAESHLAAAHQAMKESLWGEARAYLERALTLAPCTRVYDALITLEEESTRNMGAIDEWKTARTTAGQCPHWVCRVTGRAYTQWMPTTPPNDAFNTIEWGVFSATAPADSIGHISAAAIPLTHNDADA